MPEVLTIDLLAEATARVRLAGARVDHSESGDGGSAIYASLLEVFGAGVDAWTTSDDRSPFSIHARNWDWRPARSFSLSLRLFVLL